MEILKTAFYEDILIDVRNSEKGNQWPLSCYAPKSENPNIPILEDTSPEEVRAKFYEITSEGGNIKEYSNYFDNLRKKADDARKFLKSPSPELAKMLTGVITTKNPILTSEQKADAFSSFKFDVTAQAPKNSGIFAGGSVSAVTETKNSSSLSLFSSNSQVQGSSIFSVSQVQPNTGGSASSIFSVPQQKTEGSSSSIFGAPHFPRKNIFSAPENQQKSEGSTSSIFGATQAQSRSIFGAPQLTSTDPAKGESNIDNLYSSETDLSQEEIECFMAPTFIIGKIPTKPPPRSLC